MTKSRMRMVGLLSGSIVIAFSAVAVLYAGEPDGDKPASPKPPEGMSAAHMQACMEAGTPGRMHKRLTREAGTWNGKCTMWMTPEADPIHSASTMKVTPVMDGRFVRVEMQGEMPGMGEHKAEGLFGYDNVGKKFVSAWIDNCNTGIVRGTGELSEDGKTINWTYSYMCPVTKQPTTLREIERTTGPNSKTLTVYGKMPESDREFKMMHIEFERATASAEAADADSQRQKG